LEFYASFEDSVTQSWCIRSICEMQGPEISESLDYGLLECATIHFGS